MSASISDQLRDMILDALPGATVEVGGSGGGHFTLEVKSSSFAGKSMLEQQRAVYSAIAPLMKGERAPVHAIDSLRCKVG